MSAYIYETHLHTSQASACADTPGREYVRRYMDAGYAGIIITDHFWRGNCAVDRSLPWREFVCRFCEGYEDALNEGIRRGFPVFFGWEETYEGDDYLIYGLDRQWLLDHPEVTRWSRKEQLDEVHRYGGCVVQAHPFRAAWYIRTIHLAPDLADAVEGDNLAGVALDRPLEGIRDYVNVIRNRRHLRPVIPVSVPEWTEDVLPERPVKWLDADDRPVERDTIEILRRGFIRT